MKNLAATRKNGLFLLAALAWLGAMALAACSNLKPLTPALAGTIGENSLDRFQYYLSKTVTLNRVTNTSDTGDESTIGQITNRTIRDKIIISPSTEGIAVVAEERLGISFEEGDDLLFFSSSVLAKGKYAIVFYYLGNDLTRPLIDYGGVAYELGFAGSEYPYLLVKAKTTNKDESNTTRLRGRRIQ
jgi:hypothetical protein